MKNRSYGLDLVRSIALLFVVMIHSFMYSGFNYVDLNSLSSFLLLSFRCLSFVGVLLFIILTGYLKVKKKPDKSHYKSIITILIVYLIMSILSLLFKKYVLHEDKSISNLIIGIFNYTTAPYSWYVKMYIGLFLLIPFLNILYNNIPTRQTKKYLIITLFVISSLFPTLSRLTINGVLLNVAPDWWGMLYPLLLYFSGCYIREFNIHINKLLNICLIILLIYLQSTLFFFYSQGSSVDSIISSENSLFSIILSILVFLLLYNRKTYSKIAAGIVAFISKASFGAYLISYCYDMIFYKMLHLFSQNTSFYFFKCTFIITPLIYLCSIITSYIVNIFINIMKKIINYINDTKRIKQSCIEPF